MDPNQQNHSTSVEDTTNEQYHEDNGKVDIDDIQGKIFIGGLSWQTTENNLRYYFEKYGELSDVALMIDKRSGKPRGFGFIKMKDPAAADIVMSNEHTIDGRLVDVKRALPRDKAPGPSRSEACKIFVGGLASEITEKEFGDYFSQYGIVKDAVVMVDRNTGSSRGFGFVTFEKEDSVEMVMKLEHEIMGKYVETKRAEPRDNNRQTFDAYGNPVGGYGGNQFGQPPQMNAYGGGYGGGRGGPGGRGGGGRFPQQGGRGGMDAYGGGGGGYGGGRFAPAGYGGAASVGYRNNGAYGGGMGGTGAPAGYGYPNAQGMTPQGYYGGGGMGAVQGGYPAYAGAPGAQNAYGAQGYGGRNEAAGGDYGQPGVQQGQPNKGYDSSAIAGYANAAAIQQQQLRSQQQGGAPQQGYYGNAAGLPAGYGAPGGGGYGMYPQGGPAEGGNGQDRNGADVSAASAGYAAAAEQQQAAQQNGQYGAYRGQGAAQGRVDRSYRPY